MKILQGRVQGIQMKHTKKKGGVHFEGERYGFKRPATKAV